MRGNTIKISLFGCLVLLVTTLSAQGSRCSDIQPFCAGNGEFVFPNSNRQVSDVVAGESGPDYGCVEFPRYPSWFYLQIENSGDLEFLISQSENENGTGAALDVDFVVWGPFNASDDYCSDEALSEENHIDCSYSDEAVEIASIKNAKQGEIYVFLITNYSELPGYINLQQTNNDVNAGSTDCTVLNGVLGGDKMVCGEDEFILNAETPDATGYQWFILDENQGDFVEIPGEINSELKVTANGDYRVLIEIPEEKTAIEDKVAVFFYEKPLIAIPAEPIFVCEQDSTVDLTQKQTELMSLNPDVLGIFQIQYFETENDVANGINIEDPTAYIVNNDETIYARIVNLNSGCTSDIAEIQLDFRSFPQVFLQETYQICVDAYGLFEDELVLGQDLGKSYKYAWYNDGKLVSQEYDLYLFEESADPVYTLVCTEEFTGCEISYSTTIEYLSAPNSVKIDILKGDFQDNWNVEVITASTIGHSSEYEYSLDGGTFTDNSVFHNIPRGLHEITVREAGGCGRVFVEQFTVIGYDFFFTPNGDGYNDEWQVTQNPDYKVLKIRIFDRNGIFLKELNPEGEGWDGMINGKLLPADDYWFNLEYVNFKTSSRHNFSSHFSLRK
ncbi:T9SS type B sorting domain-containing protein [Zunongwangia atlantica]|uniref:Gliding motility-associated C-terminal domain-containing protein n=1 Tax=Zunongwangia atlantica 22II14-10F7 TaxID=1185767 RepID=A0A1Y1T461_9FLAO|nr:T9SS type B sorting domain-containing protein [Zunongwangia atlantica]ORL45816.1 hypothetical protein IIF7_09195 [Zunongwangia atlantica 22II14-10F7]